MRVHFRTQPTTPTHETAALRCEVDAAFFVWAMLPPGSRKETRVRAHLAHLKARLGRVPSASREGVHHA